VPSLLPSIALEFTSKAVAEFLASFTAVPEIYDINPGSIGSIHGERKEANPAPAETIILASSTMLIQSCSNIKFLKHKNKRVHPSIKHISRLRPNEVQIKKLLKCIRPARLLLKF
jgi:hypothetical protein